LIPTQWGDPMLQIEGCKVGFNSIILFEKSLLFKAMIEFNEIRRFSEFWKKLKVVSRYNSETVETAPIWHFTFQQGMVNQRRIYLDRFIYQYGTGGLISNGHGTLWEELKVIFHIKRFIHYSSPHCDPGPIESVPPSGGKPASIRRLDPPPEKPLFPQKAPLARAVRVISELCSKLGMNFIRRHTFSMEKSDNDPLLGVHVRCQNPRRT
jgi:hypothetical protein